MPFLSGAAPSKIDDEFWASPELAMQTELFDEENWWKIF
jgi:hypothetical protein